MPPVFWIQRQDIGPSARSGHGMAFDAGRSRVVMFGGDVGGTPGADTWEWDGSLWTQVADTGPSPRRGTAIAYASADSKVYLFGGGYGAGLLADTWTFNGTDWVQIADTGPSPRSDHAMAYDAARNRMVLFSGQAAPAVSDTWEWDGSGWVQMQDTGPAPRYGHVLAYDGALGRVVLFGGANPTGAGLGDTWSWNGTTWTQEADTGPAPRVGAAVSGGGSVLLFGGIDTLDPAVGPASRVIYHDTWRWAGGSWVQVQDIGPAGRWGHGMAFRPDTGRSVLFGGSSSASDGAADLRGDTWEVPDQANGGAPDIPGQPPVGGVEVMSVQVNPQLVTVAGQPLDVAVQLSGPAQPGMSLDIAIFSVVGGNATPLQPSGYTIPFVGLNGGVVGAQFTLFPDGSAVLTPGDYVVGVAVSGGMMQPGYFQIA